MTAATSKHYTVDEYLAFERASQTKHEDDDGRIYAMGGKLGACLHRCQLDLRHQQAIGLHKVHFAVQ
jgi:hypothetical protein